MKHFVLGLVLLAGSALAAEEVKDFGRDRLNTSPRHADWVDIKSGARAIKAFVVYPERKDKVPAVLVISEIFGLTDWVRSLCDELAENGVIAIAPDLHGGRKFEDLDGARKATSELSNEQVKADLELVIVKGSYDATLTGLLASLPGTRIGFESGHVTVGRYDWWRQAMTAPPRLLGARQQPHQQLIDHGHVECIERPPASASGLHTLRSLYH